MLNFLSAVGAFFVSLFLFNLVLPAGWATVLAAVVAIIVFFGFYQRRV